MAKKSCPITRAEFRAHAKPLTVNINDVPLQAEVKEFSTGSLGWFINGKMNVEVNGKSVAVQIGMNLTIIGSKELPADAVAGQQPSPGQAMEPSPREPGEGAGNRS